MIDEIDGSGYQNKNRFYNAEFKKLLGKMVLCYKRMVNDGVELKNNENSIRDKMFYDYLNNDSIRNEVSLCYYIFNIEVPENENVGRVDIKIQKADPLVSTKVYYIIECKRLNKDNLRGRSGLNAEYVLNGIDRFVSCHYSSYCMTNGMIGFVVDDLDIDTNYENINYVMKTHFPKMNIIQPLEPENFIEDFKPHYSSKHKTMDGKNIILFHLMFDFSKNIEA